MECLGVDVPKDHIYAAHVLSHFSLTPILPLEWPSLAGQSFPDSVLDGKGPARVTIPSLDFKGQRDEKDF